MKNLGINLLFTLSEVKIARLPVLMRNSFLPLAFMVLILLVTAPAAAERSSQSGAREQVTVSAHIVSGESVRFASPASRNQSVLRFEKRNAPMARTYGETIAVDQQRIMLTEFH